MTVYWTCELRTFLQKAFKTEFNQFNIYLFSAKIAVYYESMDALVCSPSQFMIRSMQRTRIKVSLNVLGSKNLDYFILFW